MLRAAESLLRKGLITAKTAPPYDEDTRYAATPAGGDFRSAVQEYRARCFRYALTAIPTSTLDTLKSATPALQALAAALGYREVRQQGIKDPG